MIQDNSASPQTKETIDALWRLQKIILDTLDFNQVVNKTVNSILTESGYLNLGYRILVLTLVDKQRNILRRIALSATEEAKKALEASAIPFAQIEIPLNAEDNFLIKALKEKKSYITHYWPDIFRPVLSPEEAVANQNASGIKTSMLYPLIVKEEAIGVMIFSMVKSEEEVTNQEKDLIARFTDIVGLAVQNSLLYMSLQEKTQELQIANERLRTLDHLKDEFVSLASHELRTPMTSIRSYVWMLLEGKDTGTLNEKQRLYLDRTYQSTIRLINLVQDMLSVSRIESGRMKVDLKPLSIVQLIKEAFIEVEATAQEKKLALIFDEHVQVRDVMADKDKIKEVLINLIGNSLKFTPAGGNITVSLEQKDGMVITRVADTGKGIKQEDISKLFQKFGMVEGNYTYLPTGQGTGLGLYISKGLVELHGGKISVESEGENKGTTFSFSLKIA